MSFQLVIPGGLLSSRARVCFTNRGRLLENDRSKARTIFDPVLVCLNFLSHEWGASQSNPRRFSARPSCWCFFVITSTDLLSVMRVDLFIECIVVGYFVTIMGECFILSDKHCGSQ